MLPSSSVTSWWAQRISPKTSQPINKRTRQHCQGARQYDNIPQISTRGVIVVRSVKCEMESSDDSCGWNDTLAEHFYLSITRMKVNYNLLAMNMQPNRLLRNIDSHIVKSVSVYWLWVDLYAKKFDVRNLQMGKWNHRRSFTKCINTLHTRCSNSKMFTMIRC